MMGTDARTCTRQDVGQATAVAEHLSVGGIGTSVASRWERDERETSARSLEGLRSSYGLVTCK
eukprot:6406882-Amphidinium_carterae.2